MHTLQLLTSLVEHHQGLAYLIIFVGIIFEGEFFVISTGILAHLGALNFAVSLIFIFFGGLGKTFLGYYLGRTIHDKWHSTRFCRYVEKKVYTFMPRFRQKPFWSIFLSKFIMGANHIVILFSGFQRINYKKYLKAEIISTAIWAPGLLTLGYLFSYTALHITREIGEFSLIIVGFIVVFIILDKLLGWLYGLFEEMWGSSVPVQLIEDEHKH
jgi:membrane protein DedA with SNARE-associated domain